MIAPRTGAAAAAVTVVGRIAATLADPHRAAAAHRGGRPWPQSLAGGAAGIALLHIERARSGHGEDRTAHAWLTAAVQAPLSTAGNAGLFYGAPCLAFAVHAACSGERHYREARARLHAATCAITTTRLRAAHARIDRGERPALKEFDLIRGLAGLSAYHLAFHPGHPLTTATLSYLVRLTTPLKGGDVFPPWWTGLAPTGEPDPDAYPQGHGNLGLSHGIGSALAVLCLAIRRGVHVPGADEAAGRICAWIDRWRQPGQSGTWWPGLICAAQARAEAIAPHRRPRPSWCYGIAGTARAQQLAGLALGDAGRVQAAEEAMLAVLRDPAQVELLDGIGLCHGKAGLLQSAWRMAADARTPHIASELGSLADALAEDLARPADDFELLDGAAGAALALHTIGTGAAPASRWDSVLALA
ncbi:lantibiotic modifying enzyme [Spongiactinospora rosea]|uniref:Lantibiotic modifying enzyme n=1 Tax=Spongiactinospora rosea TaxID=2248750 RepID=A0A366LUK0_9ACTN|nr:lanthionine synthetase C family protein [Spongiactinospora rosea]RBQ17223.1 lantibiotic modifying enzyme [Spongiactinospora rosea]